MHRSLHLMPAPLKSYACLPQLQAMFEALQLTLSLTPSTRPNQL